MANHYRFSSMLLVVGIAAVLMVISLIGLANFQKPQPVLAKATFIEEAQLPNNAACLSCHMVEGQVKEFPNGDLISVVVAPETYGSSAHATLSCQVCHTNISGYPHPENLAQSSRDYTLQYQNTCNQCHPSQASELMDSVHSKAMAEGNPNAPICADCHNPHQQPKIQKDEQGRLMAAEHAQSAMVCGKCHSTIYEDYAKSVHGTGVLIEKNPDVPSCIDCHGVHTVRGPSGGAAFRLSSPKICADCHTNEEIMSKYGLSTQVLQTYVADFHGTTVTLFEKLDPDQQINMPVCYDCHGVHDIRPADDPLKGLQVKQNLLATCQKCHPDATENFPDAWLGHYIPDRNRYPLVYWVNEFYKYFIPTVLGGMGLFVVSDIYRRWVVDRRKKNAVPAEDVENREQTQSSKGLQTQKDLEKDTQPGDEKRQDEENS
ncbi:MAG: hypothetical protein AB1457_03350 [Chloroflexota bacterium]|nr:MAG: hypothetical protein KatS3mg047_1003 [Bellilinea sp.]